MPVLHPVLLRLRPARRVAVLPVGLLAATLLLTACGTDDGTVAAEPTAEPTPTATTAAPQQSPTGQPAEQPEQPAEPSPTADDAQVVSITLAGGQVSGVEPRTEVPLGTTVRLTVTSDVTDEVHVHGYDEYLDLTPGQPAQLEFVADTPGLFEVELHDAGTVLTRLQVQ